MDTVDPASASEESAAAAVGAEASAANRQTGTAPGRSTHLDLLAWAGELQQAALRHDVASVHSQLGTLRAALLEHMGDESAMLTGLTVPAANAIRSGQRKLLAQLDTLVDSAERETDDCRCIEGTSRLAAGLRRQGRLETGLQRR